MKVPARTLVTLPDSLSFATGDAIACGTGTAWGALQRLELRCDPTIAAFGRGPLGRSATQLAAALGVRVEAPDISEERLERAPDFGEIGRAPCTATVCPHVEVQWGRRHLTKP